MSSVTTKPSIESLKSLVSKGKVIGRCVHRETVNHGWDVETNYHATEWEPARVKEGYYDEQLKHLNLEPFLFSDTDESLLLKEDNGLFILSSTKRKFVYQFREGDNGQERAV